MSLIMDTHINIVTTLNKYLKQLQFNNFPIDILRIIYEILIDLSFPDTMCYHSLGISLRYKGDVYVYHDYGKCAPTDLILQKIPNVPRMYKCLNNNVKMIKSFRIGFNRYIFVQTLDGLYYVKDESYYIDGGYVITHDETKCCTKTMIKLTFLPKNAEFTDIDGSHNMCFAIVNGTLYTLFPNPDDAELLYSEQVKLSKHVVVTSVKCCISYVLLLASDGLVYHLNCVILSDSFELSPLKNVKIPGSAIAISCGNSHSLVLMKNGDIWGFGSNICGQLGSFNKCAKIHPTLLSISNVKNILCFCNSTYVTTKDGLLYSCGNNNRYELGLNHCQKHVTKFTKVNISERVCCVSRDGKTTMVLLENGEIMSCGLLSDGKFNKSFQKMTEL